MGTRALLTLGVTGLSALTLSAAASAQEGGGTLPTVSFTPDQLYQIIAPDLGAEKHNQPSVVNGYLMLAGNASHQLWDISDPYAPELVSAFEGPYGEDEAESHMVAFAKTADARYLSVTISGYGVDLWDLTDASAPELLSTVILEGIDYGDNSEAVWGVFWQGDYIYVGGTNTGLHVVDASDPKAPTVVTRVPTSEFGGVSAGPLFAVGNLLVITTPKNHGGIATLDISDPGAPYVLDFEIPEDDSYIGMMYGGHVYLLTPLRAYDVVSDPSNISLVGSLKHTKSEYMSFGDDHMFMGTLRPDGGVFKWDVSDPSEVEFVAHIEGRKKNPITAFFTDDQFPLPVGNLLVISDDEVSIGSTIAVHDTAPDSVPPRVLYVNPPDGATAQALTSRVGLSLSDQIDLRSVDAESLIVRPVGGEPLAGHWGHMQTFVSFWPDAPLSPNTTYEIVLPAGGIRDLAGNGIAETFTSVFSTGADVAAPPCKIEPLTPTAVGEPASLSAAESEGLEVAWDFGDGGSGAGASVTHTWQAPGRHAVTLTVTDSESGLSRSCAAIALVHRPLAEPRPTQASTVAIDEPRGRAWVVNPDAGTVAAVGLSDLELALEADAGALPRSVAVAPDGAVWVASQGDDQITILDGDSGEVLDVVAFDWGAAPYGVAFAPEGGRAYVTLESEGALAVVDAASRQIDAVVDLGPWQVRGLATTPGGSALVSRFISGASEATLWEVDPDAERILREIPLARSPGPDESDGGRGVPNYLSSVVVSPDGRAAWVPSKKDNTERGVALDGEPLNTTNTVRTIVSRVDLASGAEVLDARVDLDDHSMAAAVATSHFGDLLFVASSGSNRVDVLDAYEGSRIGGFATGLAPEGLALSADGHLVVQNFLSRTLSVYDVSGLLAGRDGAATLLAEVPTAGEEPLAPEVLLGKQIFYNAASPQMSQDGYISCAACHLEGREDGRVWDFTDRGEGLRNTIDLRGRAGIGHGRVHWSGNFDEIQDFENDIRLHFGGSGLMDDAAWEEETRADPLGTPKAGASERLDALSAYVSSLASFPRSPHRQADGSRTPDAEAGALIFRWLDCMDCHSGQALTDSDTGARHDVGTLTSTSGQRLGGALGGIDTPTLRGVWATAPYLHDGSAATLADALAVEGHGNAHTLSPTERDQLIAFMLQLENEELDLARLERPPPTPEPEPEAGPEPAPESAPETPVASGRDEGGCAGGGQGAAPSLALVCLALAAWRRRRSRVCPSPSGKLFTT